MTGSLSIPDGDSLDDYDYIDSALRLPTLIGLCAQNWHKVTHPTTNFQDIIVIIIIQKVFCIDSAYMLDVSHFIIL